MTVKFMAILRGAGTRLSRKNTTPALAIYHRMP